MCPFSHVKWGLPLERGRARRQRRPLHRRVPVSEDTTSSAVPTKCQMNFFTQAQALMEWLLYHINPRGNAWLTSIYDNPGMHMRLHVRADEEIC
jgi:hypothetical protein